ncbi:MAG: T9SS type A sorting domain-containing protein [Ignavibacteria bacterium]|jgi:hypothetical protein|nr:T9SS type A sorting domain-containing protein [Ignavibacteria bacterium]MCU7501608.1 T9SS type A sorting domain-containing protein [Ignavibacteria bacterium]MCU7517145.1 T9SS type A sorting domain-containing protein [Ignavibacteria bacterium]
MKRVYFLCLFFSALFSVSLNAQVKNSFLRADTISVLPVFEKADFSNIVAGVDLDKDGKPEIYGVNGNMDDFPDEMIPSLVKFELQDGKWKQVWSTSLDLTAQNSWPAICVGDLDKDGRPEIIWGPTNYLSETNPNPIRIAVFEARGDTSEALGIDNFGNSLPNATWTITTDAQQQIRPIRWFVSDPDSDDQNELVYCDYSGTEGQSTVFGVISVDSIPNNGGGVEKWTMEVSAKSPGMSSIPVNATYDIAELNNVLYAIQGNGTVYPVKFENKAWKTLPAQTTVGNSKASWKSAQVVDIDNDGKKEIVFGSWKDGKVYLCRQEADTLVSTQIGDFTQFGITQLNGGASGDLDGDGKIDFAFGTRADKSKPVNAVCRLQYLGGAIDDPKSYSATIIDSLIHATSGQLDAMVITDVDNDKKMELVYTSGYGRGPIDLPRIPIVILKYDGTSFVKQEIGNIPETFNLEQNFPNPFNPSTTIKFGLPGEASVSLKIFNILGQEVATLINNEHMTAGTYNVGFNASSLSSGTYIYQLSYNNQTVNRKMLLMK